MSEGAEALKHLDDIINELVPPQRHTLEFLAATLLKLKYWMLQCTAAALIAPVVPAAVVPVAASPAYTPAVAVLKANDNNISSSRRSSSNSSSSSIKAIAQSISANTSAESTSSALQTLPAAVVQPPQVDAVAASATAAVNLAAAAPVTLSDALNYRQTLTAYRDSMRQTLQNSSSAEEQLQLLQWLSDIAMQQAPALQCCDALCAHLSMAAAADISTLSMMRKFVHDAVSTAGTDAATKVQSVSFVVRCKLSNEL
jgi:hypothetical protein